MPRTAALLCIHNEAHRLPWWMAHHLALGFSALLVCDDHSTDGSRELLTQAARHYDIRIIETDAQDTDALHRREAGLNSLIQREHEHFDWMLPLAIDEYFLPTQSTLSAFFADIEQHMGTEAFLQTASIPINWCIMGLGKWHNQSLTGPIPHPRALFTTHAAENFTDHRVTRDFFRPTANQTLPNPFARLQTPPNWSKARILHDAAANSHTPQTRRYFDRNEHSFPQGQQHLSQSLTIAARFIQGLIAGECYALQNQDELKASHNPSSKTKTPPMLARFQLCCGETVLALHTKQHIIRLYNKEELLTETDLIPLQLLQNLDTPNIAWLYADALSPLPYIPVAAPHALHPSSLLACIALELTPQGENMRLRLRSTGQALLGDSSQHFTLKPLPQPPMPDKVDSAFQHFLAYGMSAAGLKAAIYHSRWLSPSVIGAIYAQLPAQEARSLFSPLMYRLFHNGTRS
ncbi:glycosyltransferase family 2 protein [Bombella pollinis]|uniref:Glycosyltransferase family 2 protein n=1 Tax=Bombella pollinis TaxID=2967337 RepID=A0ABT3WPY0_9PROT|nr:glycosyltransferase family 2 protein [Bombella pollinis]MCX5620284.1 glycosyltransferase family 2 protein [Bombella pollinis]